MLLFKTGVDVCALVVYALVTYTVQNMHAKIQYSAMRMVDMTCSTAHTVKGKLCVHMPRLLVESGLRAAMQLQNYGLYSSAACFVQGFMKYCVCVRACVRACVCSDLARMIL